MLSGGGSGRDGGRGKKFKLVGQVRVKMAPALTVQMPCDPHQPNRVKVDGTTVKSIDVKMPSGSRGQS